MPVSHYHNQIKGKSTYLTNQSLPCALHSQRIVAGRLHIYLKVQYLSSATDITIVTVRCSDGDALETLLHMQVGHAL